LNWRRRKKGGYSMSPLSKEIVNLKAELIVDNISHPGIIESLCDEGIYMRVLPETVPVELPAGKGVEVKLHQPSGQPQSIRCKVKWAYKTPPHELTTSIGLHLLIPLPDYEELFTTEK
jgi:hypothetical protein